MKHERSITITGTQPVKLDGIELEVSYTATCTLTFIPGRFSGPPEDCYPDDSDMGYVSLQVTEVFANGEAVVLSDDYKRYVQEQLDEDVIADQLWDEFDRSES